MSNEINDMDSVDAAAELLKDNIDVLLIADAEANTIKPVIRKGIFGEFIKDSWRYTDLIETLWYHFSNSSDKIDEKYRVFLPTSGKFPGKYGRRINLMIDGIVHIIQVTVYPIGGEKYLFTIDELDKSQFRDETLTENKVTAIQNIYLFSMYIDIVKDTTNSISVTELSDEVINQQLKYTEWRKMIVNMISKEYQKQFLEQTDPEYLRTNYAPGQTSSFDCLMMNLEGKYIWVKLIFSRAETNNDSDFRFVFMVQNIHDTATELHQTLKKYEKMASIDSLTSVYNHGRIETEMNNAIAEHEKSSRSVSVMMLDIDHFKQINDKYGHSVGDMTLVRFTNTISREIEGKQAVLGRWGGEEFVIVCYDTPFEEARTLAEKIRNAVENEPFEKIEHITCSIGVTSLQAADQFDKAFERMDKALYRAKSKGRNLVIAKQ